MPDRKMLECFYSKTEPITLTIRLFYDRNLMAILWELVYKLSFEHRQRHVPI